MKKIYKIFLVATLLTSLTFTQSMQRIQAQEEENIPTATQEEEKNEEIKEEIQEEPAKTLSEQVENEPTYSFGTLLLAILIPCLLIIIAYLIFKFVKF